MKRLFSILILIAIVGAGVSFVAAPWVAFRALRAAAAAGDVQGMVKVADFDAVRASLRPQLAPQGPSAPPPSVWKDPLGALDNAFRQPMQAPPSVEAWLSPAAMVQLTNAAADTGAKDKDRRFRPGDLLPGLSQSEVRFWDTTRSRIAVARPGHPDEETIFTFERRGAFTWKLVHIRLPAKAAV